jgi:hypothetical protein
MSSQRIAPKRCLLGQHVEFEILKIHLSQFNFLTTLILMLCLFRCKILSVNILLCLACTENHNFIYIFFH